MSVDLEKMAAEQAKEVARAIAEVAQRGGTEADFRREAANMRVLRVARRGHVEPVQHCGDAGIEGVVRNGRRRWRRGSLLDGLLQGRG